MTAELENILFVDDEPALCRAFARVFCNDPVCVRTTSSATEALELLRQQPFAVVASDYRMPGMDGVTLLSASRPLAPDSRRVLVSGCCDFDVVKLAVNRAGIDHVVTKPWANDDLRATILRAAQHYALARRQARLAAELQDRTTLLEQANQDLDAKVRTRTTNLLDSLLAALDLRDTETRWHSRRVAAYARRLAQELRLLPAEVDDVERGALLHDIGKIGVRDAILRKPGKLTAAEWDEMKQHALLGYRLLEGIDYLGAACLVVLQHQERWDGLGYPAGLRGEESIIGARIFHVADTLDAITSDRPYRQARGYDVARAEILRCSGTQFDPAVVAAYARVPDEAWAELGAPLVAVERAAAPVAALPTAASAAW